MLRSYRSKFNETTEVDVIEWVCFIVYCHLFLDCALS